MERRELRAENLPFGRQPPAIRLRPPLASEARGLNRRLNGILARERPRIALTSALMKVTGSVQFSWFAASGICEILPQRGPPYAHPTESGREAAQAALGFLFKMIRHSPEDAKTAALLMRRLRGCSTTQLPRFFGILSEISGKDHSLALLVLEAFPSRDPSLLHLYTETFSFLHKKAGKGPAREFATLFREMGQFPGSARLALDSLIFTIENMHVEDWGRFASIVCGDWRGTLASDVFRDNPD